METSNIALFNGSTDVVLNVKTGKTGSFAKAIAFATRDQRLGFSQQMYATYLSNGTYAPVVRDIVGSGLIPKSAIALLGRIVDKKQGIKKEEVIDLCMNIDYMVRKNNKEVKGQKLFYYGLVKAIVSEYGQGAVVSEQ